jgi:hypothetical protein
MSSSIDNVPAHIVIEAGLNVLSDQFEIDSPDDVAEKISELTDAEIDANQVQSLAARAADDSATVSELLRMALSDFADDDESGGVSIAIESAGQKQFVVGPDALVLATLLFGAYALHKTGGVSQSDKEISKEFDDNGKLKGVRVKEKVVYFDPFSAVARFLESIFP